MPMQVLRPAGAGITAVNSIPGIAGKKIRIVGYSIYCTGTNVSIFLSTALVPVDASILDSMFSSAGYGCFQQEYEALSGPITAPGATVYMVASTGSLYGHVDYTLE